MKQEEKTRITYEKILKAAIAEFGTKNYDNASLNTICSENQISKGLLYHNFKSKDELYFRCVETCFQAMTDYLRGTSYREQTVQAGLQKLLWQRQQFFEKNPYYANIFFYTLLQPPAHLQRELLKIRREFDAFHIALYKEQLSQMKLRDGITEDMAMQYFVLFQNMFNGYFRNKFSESKDFYAAIQDHEMSLSQMLDIILYGIAEQETREEPLISRDP